VMRTTFTFQRMQIYERRRRGERGAPPLVTCRDVLEFATIEGARCANLADRVGTLTPGKEADLVLLRTDTASLWPINNAVGTVVNMMTPGNVETVFVGGKLRKWRGRLVGVDLERTLRLAGEAREAVMRRAGFSVNLLG
jgi:5-methylthioadenosine/S-adenosylhomocysteine deaminase